MNQNDFIFFRTRMQHFRVSIVEIVELNEQPHQMEPINFLSISTFVQAYKLKMQ